MKITLCGRPGSGKSVTAKRLAQEFHLKHYSAGDYMRRLAVEQGYTIEAFAKIMSKDFDEKVDKWTENIGKTEDNFIFDSRIAFHFIPHAIKIFLDVSYEEGARRIFSKQRESEAKVDSIKELAETNKQRWAADKKRYITIYNLDMDDEKLYDAYINTTNLSIDQVIQEIKRIIPALRKAQASN
jgi:cytidylate kinase